MRNARYGLTVEDAGPPNMRSHASPAYRSRHRRAPLHAPERGTGRNRGPSLGGGSASALCELVSGDGCFRNHL
jgi:hypothetical protein